MPAAHATETAKPRQERGGGFVFPETEARQPSAQVTATMATLNPPRQYAPTNHFFRLGGRAPSIRSLFGERGRYG
jgi:hypothetical protein